jgi:hypothetical protein
MRIANLILSFAPGILIAGVGAYGLYSVGGHLELVFYVPLGLVRFLMDLGVSRSLSYPLTFFCYSLLFLATGIATFSSRVALKIICLFILMGGLLCNVSGCHAMLHDFSHVTLRAPTQEPSQRPNHRIQATAMTPVVNSRLYSAAPDA